MLHSKQSFLTLTLNLFIELQSTSTDQKNEDTLQKQMAKKINMIAFIWKNPVFILDNIVYIPYREQKLKR